MPTYKVGVVLSATAGKYRAGLTAAAKATRRTETALSRASGTARTFGRTTDEAGRRTRRALETAAGSVRPLNEALRRTGTQARRAGDAVVDATRRGERGVRGLTRRYRDLGGAMRRARGGPAGIGGAPAGIGGAPAGIGGALRRTVGALGAGYALSAAGGRELSVDTKLQYLGVEAGLSPAATEALRRQIYGIATRDDIRIPAAELLDAVIAYGERTGDYDQAIANLETTAQLVQRAHARGKDIGLLAASLRKLEIYDAAEWKEAAMQSVEAQREGAFTAADLAAVGDAPIAAWAAMRGQKGTTAYRDLLAIAQVAMKGTGRRDTAATAIRAIVTAFSNQQKIQEIEKLVPLYQDATRTRYRSPARVIEDLVAAVGGKTEHLSHIFGEEAIQVINAFVTKEGRDVYRRTMEKTAAPDEGKFTEEVTRLADRMEARIQTIKDQADVLFHQLGAGPMGGMIAGASALGGSLLMGGLALGLGGPTILRGGRGLWRLGRRGLGLFRRRGPAPTPAAGAGAVRMSVGTTTAGPSLTAQTAGRPLGRLAQAGSALRAASGQVTNLAGRVPGAGLVRTATRRVPALAAATGGISVAGSLARGRTGEAAETAAGVGGGLAGAALGAFGGPAAWFTMPAGAIIGGLAGGWLGDTAGRAAAQHAFGEDESGGGLLPDAALDAAGELDTLAAQADAAGRALETLRPAPLDRPHPTIHQRIGQIGPITIQSAADDPRDVADAVTDQVVDRVRQALADEQRRLTDTLVADPSPEGAF